MLGTEMSHNELPHHALSHGKKCGTRVTDGEARLDIAVCDCTCEGGEGDGGRGKVR